MYSILIPAPLPSQLFKIFSAKTHDQITFPTSTTMPPVRSGFKVGPANLPDGTYRRKGTSISTPSTSNKVAVKKIKAHLIHKAQLKRDLAKLKSRAANETASAAVAADDGPAASLDPHPDRQAMMDDDEEEEQAPQQRRRRPPRPSTRPDRDHRRRPKADPFAPQAAERERLQDAAAKKAAGAERERVHKLVARARKPGRDGRRKLGRESALLLDKVKKLVGAG
jgi:hypothetical protein